MVNDKGKIYGPVILMIILTLVNLEIPYSDKSFLQEFVFSCLPGLTTRTSQVIVYLLGLPIFVGWVWAGLKIIKVKKISGSDMLLFFFAIGIIFQVNKPGLEYMTSYVYTNHEGIESIQVKDTSLDLDLNPNYYKNGYLQVDSSLRLNMKFHNTTYDQVTVHLVLAEPLEAYFTERVFEFDFDIDNFSGDESILREHFKLSLNKDVDKEKLSDLKLKEYDYTIVLVDGSQTNTFIRNDMY